RRKLAGRAGQRDNFAKTLLNIRRSSIFAVLLFGYAYYRSTDSTAGLSSIVLLSFAAIARIRPPPDQPAEHRWGDLRDRG
ncbi:hypothetical protein AB9F46_35970, partial [Rhizobium leguminosarum]|uniref:hypothetical protein n=1 Tax=Rhizobium leguminosarum TaxID=384 RepID=UPI003F9E94F6